MPRPIERIGLAMAACILLLAGAAIPAIADDAETGVDPPAQELELADIVVTGTRIPNPVLTSTSPLVRTRAEDLLSQGTVRVEDALSRLPQVFSFQNSGKSNGATGTATVNLRGLGAERSLVLVNGRRLPPGSPLQGGAGADINQIPGALIESVDVLTGGASATYGSDAVAGVINFHLMDDFEGVRLTYQLSQYQHDNDDTRWQDIVRDAGYRPADGSVRDGDIANASLIVGGAFAGGRGHVTAYATYRDVQAVRQGSRDYSSCALSNDLTACAGSATQAKGTFSDFGILALHGQDSFDYTVAGDQFVPREGATYNYGPSNYFQRPDKRWTAGLLADFDVHDRAQAYTELMFMDNRSVAQIAPSGAFFVTDTLGCGNAFLSSQQFELLCGRYGLTRADEQTVFIGRRSVEGGPRQDDLRHTSYRGLVGLRGDLTDLWRYDLYYMRARVGMEQDSLNYLSNSRIQRALDAVRDPATGQIVCRSALDGSDPGCVPWNIFREGAVTQPMLDYLTLPLSSRGFTEQTTVSGHVAGNLGDYGIRSPFAVTGPDVVLGGEYRSERLQYSPDEAYRSGDGAGQGGARHPVSGEIGVGELFVEAGIPVVHDAPYADEVVLHGGYRHSDYDYGTQTDTFGLRAGWAVNSDFRVRASVQQALRGPGLRERFLPQAFGLFDMTADPCGGPVTDGTTAAGRTLEECARSGVTAAQFGHIEHSPANQYNFLRGGNPDLAPEESDTVTYGFVWTPSVIDGLTLSFDYYAIEVREAIGMVGPAYILNQCLDGNTSQCAKVRRGRSGDLWLSPGAEDSGHVASLLDNLAIVKVEGYDLAANYRLDLGDWGRLDVSNVLAIAARTEAQASPGSPTFNCAGKWGPTCGSPSPEFRNNLRLTWLTPWQLQPALGWRYVSRVEDPSPAGLDLGARHYFDLSAVWDFSDSASLRFGINNLFDRAPPIAGGAADGFAAGNGNTFPGLYDALGRYAFVVLSIEAS